MAILEFDFDAQAGPDEVAGITLCGEARFPLRHVAIRDLARVNPRAALAAVPQLTHRYSDGLDWLERRLEDSAHGRASVLGVIDGNVLAVIAIETYKGPHLRKLSTFGVAPHWRLAGLGGGVMTALRCRWLAEDVDQVHVTVDRTDDITKRFFQRQGFAEQPDMFIDYGGERRDCVCIWSAATDPIAYTAFY